jgi:hypothetical protein
VRGSSARRDAPQASRAHFDTARPHFTSSDNHRRCETGYFQVSEEGQAINEHAWNRVANSLFLESPAGAFLTPDAQHSGFSYCTKVRSREMAPCPCKDRPPFTIRK